MEPSGKQEKRKTEKKLEKIGNQGSGYRSWNELRYLAADRQKSKGLIDNLCS